MDLIYLNTILSRLMGGDPTIQDSERDKVTEIATRLISDQNLLITNQLTVQAVIKIANIVYNNIGGNPIMPDDIYDRLIVICKNLGIPTPVGAPPIDFKGATQASSPIDTGRTEDGLLRVVDRVPDYDKMMFYQPMTSNMTRPMAEDFIYHHDSSMVSKKARTAGHQWDLCGTLDKCKYVTNADAINNAAFQDPSVLIFERDFLAKYCQEGILDPNNIELIVSFKYDGVSIENTVDGDTIISSCTRGDTDNNEASDMTPVLGGMTFARARNLAKGTPIGIKNEYIVTKNNLRLLKERFGKNYVNARNAVIGLTSSLDARMYRDYLTPIPLETSLNVDRLTEIMFMNQHYTKGLDFRYSVIKGDFNTVLYMVHKFSEEAQALRDYQEFMYDGIVVEILNPNIRQYLGKRGAIPRYSIAIKFPPLMRYSTFTHYTYSVGQDGVIVPMAHFLPVEFFGAIHDKTTAHSYERFKTLGLHKGDKVTLTLNNDVIVYIRRAPDHLQPKQLGELEQFPSVCPSCGGPLYVSESGSSVFCTNFWCPERAYGRLSNTFKKLNAKGFSYETIKKLEVTRLSQLYSYDKDEMARRIGHGNAINLLGVLDYLKNAGLPDYRLIGAIGFTNIAAKTWKSILEQFPIERVLNEPNETFRHLAAIDGIGETTVETIVQERPLLIDELRFIFNNFRWARTEPYDPCRQPKKKIVFSGVHDKELAAEFNQLGDYEADVKAGFTKDCYALIVPNVGYMSTKVAKAFKFLGQAYAKAYNTAPLHVTWENLQSCAGLTPMVLTRDMAHELILKSKMN